MASNAGEDNSDSDCFFDADEVADESTLAHPALLTTEPRSPGAAFPLMSSVTRRAASAAAGAHHQEPAPPIPTASSSRQFRSAGRLADLLPRSPHDSAPPPTTLASAVDFSRPVSLDIRQRPSTAGGSRATASSASTATTTSPFATTPSLYAALRDRPTSRAQSTVGYTANVKRSSSISSKRSTQTERFRTRIGPPLASNSARQRETEKHSDSTKLISDPSARGRPRSSGRSVAGLSMASSGREKSEDLFLEIANTQAEEEHIRRTLRSRAERFESNALKRFSLPINAIPNISDRPNEALILDRPTPRLHASSMSNGMSRPTERLRGSPDRRSAIINDDFGVSNHLALGRTRRFSHVPDRSPLSPTRSRDSIKASDPQQLTRGRLQNFLQPEHELLPARSHESFYETSAESSEHKSDSIDSHTADTVWDELDDLKTRIKNLETNKPPTTPSAVVSGDGERPRTATTNPTTIDSSPKQEHKSITGVLPTTEIPVEPSAPPMPAASTHPLLSSALEKAKPLLNGSLFRILEATANDALQLVTITNGISTSGISSNAACDRQIKRKADTMCRNLTDLCLALCEGKHELPSMMASPIVLDTPLRKSSTVRLRRDARDTEAPSAGRSFSRLEARRTSILGVPAATDVLGTSPRDEGPETSASETEQTPSHSFDYAPRRVSRAPSLLLRSRMHRREDSTGGVEEDDPTLRPPSRAMTEIGGLRLRAAGLQNSQSSTTQQKSPNVLRYTHEMHTPDMSARDYSRVTSFGSDPRRRRLYEHFTPPVTEEDVIGIQGDPAYSHLRTRSNHRLSSLGGQLSNRRASTFELGAHNRFLAGDQAQQQSRRPAFAELPT